MTIEEVVQSHFSSQNAVELAKVLTYVGEIHPNVIVEVGMDKGGSMMDWKRAFAPEILIGIDNNFHAMSTEIRHELGEDNLILGDSHLPETVEILKKKLNGRAIDFLYLDGDHTYNGVKKDYELYAPLVRSGGIIGFDDIKLNEPKWVLAGVEVCRFWNEVIGKVGSKYLEFWDQYGASQGTGDGIYYKP